MVAQTEDPGSEAGRLLYLAEQLAGLHASTDLGWLAGRFELLGEKVLGATVTFLAMPDERGAFRAAASSLARPAVARDAWAGLGIDALAGSAEAAQLFVAQETAAHPAVVRVGDIFPTTSPELVGREAIVAPLLCEREFLGVAFFLVDASPMVEAIAEVLAANVAVAVSQIRERQDARRLHSVDPTLWIPDDHFLLEQFRREVNRARRYGREVGLALLRVENEGDVRARFGDFFTDHLLRRIGSQLLESVRDSDVLGAFAGGYAIIHTETGLTGTQLSAERLRDYAVEMVRRRFPEVGGVRISAHAVSYPTTSSSVDGLLAHLAETPAQEAVA